MSLEDNFIKLIYFRDKMKRGDLEIFGIFIAMIGAVLFFNSFVGGVTGFVVLEDVNMELGSILGVILIVFGLMLGMAGRDQTKELEEKVRRELWAGRP